MTSPAPFVPVKNYYFTINVDAEPRRLDLVECFKGDDIALVITFVDNNGNAVDVSGATAVLQVGKRNSGNVSVYSDDDGIDLTSNKLTATFNTELALNNEGGAYKYQIRISRDGKSSVVAWGNLDVNELIV